jgi:hypothetical protein
MSHPLDESNAKLIRAREHLGSLDAEVTLWLQEMRSKGEAARSRVEFDFQAGLLTVFVDHVPLPPPHRFGLITGDVAHNLRSALDHLAWELANLYRPERVNDRTTAFPMTTSEREWLDCERMVRHINPVHIELIKQEQPFVMNSEDSARSHHLAWLSDLDNRDKHQGIHALSYSAEAFYVSPVPIRDWVIAGYKFFDFHEEPGTKIMEVTIRQTGPDPQVNMQPLPVTPSVSIRHGNEIGDTFRVLTNLSNAVGDILLRFWPQFP